MALNGKMYGLNSGTPRFLVIDPETGQLVRAINQYDFFRVYPTENKYAVPKDIVRERLSYTPMYNYVKMDIDGINRLLSLSDSELRIALFLITHIGYFNNRVHGNNNKEYGIKLMARDLGIREETLYKKIVSLEKKDIIRRYNKAIFVNPFIALKGKFTDSKYKALFENPSKRFRSSDKSE